MYLNDTNVEKNQNYRVSSLYGYDNRSESKISGTAKEMGNDKGIVIWMVEIGTVVFKC
jgi:hypothetical protein